MLKAVLVAVLVISNGLAHAAKCKPIEDEFDATLGVRVVAFDWKNLSHPMRPVGREMTGGVGVRAHGSRIFLIIGIEWLRFIKTFPTPDMINNSLSISEGSELLIGLADGSVITLHSTEAVIGETTYETPKPHSGKSFAVTSKVSAHYEIDEAAQAALLAQGAMAVRMRTSTDGDQDVRIYSGGREHIREVIECIREAIK